MDKDKTPRGGGDAATGAVGGALLRVEGGESLRGEWIKRGEKRRRAQWASEKGLLFAAFNAFYPTLLRDDF